ncbi:nmrA-family protein [Fistulina hepatica ATCC 64428]|uniref:NmrA-family protein n=1 Tax=Fistulina hepatica ATCC 64428 TaxID=1128425 RepID=A0A0D7AP18_9AGAR|nr:nmrA-family protein [Fistulina hepatica ATCC 64428]
MASSKKLILVICATGAQGVSVIDALLKEPTPYAVRALTRDPSNQRAKDLAAKGVELFQGRFDDFPRVKKALDGCWGAWVNTDGFTVGERAELYCGFRIFELAKQTPSLRHYVWSSLDYASKKGNFDPTYKCEHYDGKARIAEWMKEQESVVSDTGMSWAVVTTGPYMDMLKMPMFGPLNKRADGTIVFASGVGNGHVAMIALDDLGWWARYTFDHRAETSGRELEIASDMVGWDYLVATFTKFTGLPAVYRRQTISEWWNNFLPECVDAPLAIELDDGITCRENFSAFWSLWRDDVVERDMDWIRGVHPGTLNIETWMRENDYTGDIKVGQGNILKNADDGKMKMLFLNHDVIAQL